MLKIKHILFPVDFSERCKEAAIAVKAMSQHFKASLTVLNVADIPIAALPYEMYAALQKELARASSEKMKSFVDAHFRAMRVKSTIETGDPASAIVKYAERNRVDLIMMPTHGVGSFRQLLIGSVTSKVLHDARCPVWTSAHNKANGSSTARPYRNILCAVDLNSEAVALIRCAAWLARRYDATVKLVHVIPALNETSRNPGEIELRRYLTRGAEAEFEVFMDHAGVRSELLLRGGNIPARLAETAREQRADLLIVGRGHARKALGRLRTHSVAIIRDSPCPVLSI